MMQAPQTGDSFRIQREVPVKDGRHPHRLQRVEFLYMDPLSAIVGPYIA